MDLMSWLAVVSGVISIIAFVFAIWVWLKSDIKVLELSAALQTVHGIAESVVWNTHFVNAGDESTRLSQMERAHGQVMAIRTLTAKYVEVQVGYRNTEIGTLIDRRIIWTTDWLGRLESSREVREVWLLTHDLEPDLSAAKTTAMVKKNVATGTRYVYFHPADLPDVESKVRRLRRNVGGDTVQVRFVAISDPGLFTPANVIMFFKDEPAYGTDLVFQEIVLTKISERGIFWQEHERDYAAKLVHRLRQELDRAS